MADATGVTVAITGGNALVNTPATPSTITLDAAGTGVGIASATGTASGYVAPGPVVTTVVQNTAPKQAVPHAAVPGSIGITVADTDLTADVTTGTATDYVANGPIASTDVIVAQSTAPVPSPDGGATPATPGE